MRNGVRNLMLATTIVACLGLTMPAAYAAAGGPGGGAAVVKMFGGGHSGGGSGAGVTWGIIGCSAGVWLGAATINGIYDREAAGPGLCGIGMRPATCADIKRGEYAPQMQGLISGAQAKAAAIAKHCKAAKPKRKKKTR